MSFFSFLFGIVNTYLPIFLTDTNDLHEASASNTLQDLLHELVRTVHYLKSSKPGVEITGLDLPREKFGSKANANKYLRVANLGDEFWLILEKDNSRPVEEQRLNISNIYKGASTDKGMFLKHVRLLAFAPKKIGKKDARVCVPFL